jgi:hypothetical protein
MEVAVYTPDQQGIGAFDGGKITEQKPIGFPGEGSEVIRIGPYFIGLGRSRKKQDISPVILTKDLKL